MDTDYVDALQTLGMDTLLDAPVGAPVYVSEFSFCLIDNSLYAIGLSRLEADDMVFGLVGVTRRADGTVDVTIPEGEDLYDALDFEFEEEFADLGYDPTEDRFLTIWTLLQTAPCPDWGEIASDPATLLPVASIDGATSMSGLLADLPTLDQ